MVSKDRVLYLSQKCLPFLLENNNTTKKEIKAIKDIKSKPICRLWGGMGHIYRITISNNKNEDAPKNLEFVIKHVTPPKRKNQSFGDRRKAYSYRVEANFYRKLAKTLMNDHDIKLPMPYYVEEESESESEEVIICMSLLEGRSVDMYNNDEVRSVLQWMAKFHASYYGNTVINEVVTKVGLQPIGSYWHLDTRPDEHDAMNRQGWEGRLKRAARAIDSCLKRDPMQCLIHGDPKEANIMILNNTTTEEEEVAMYDLQYSGKGSPTRDIAYFLCSSCDESEENLYVNYYYDCLVEELLQNKKNDVNPLPTLEHFQDSLELTFCDFCRFMCGWGNWGYDIQSRVKITLDKLDNGKDLGSEQAYDEAIRRVFW